MRKIKTKKRKNSTKIAVLFVIFVFTIIFISLIVKALDLIRESKFDGESRFTISVSSNNSVKILSFSPIGNSVVDLTIHDSIKRENLKSTLGIPVDGFVDSRSLDIEKDYSDLIPTIIINYKEVETNLTILDLIRLFFFSKGVSSNDVSIIDINSLDKENIDDKINNNFVDEKIEAEDLAIEIVNSTSVSGLGARFGQIVENMGGKVVQISSDNKTLERSIILYNDDKTHTLDKLRKAFGFDIVKMEKEYIGDITIIIGEDNKELILF